MSELERLGETEGFAWTLLELLDKAGWDVHVRAAFAGDGVLLIAARADLDFDLRHEGATVAAAAPELFLDCVRYRPRASAPV